MKPKNSGEFDLAQYFKNPISLRQKQYEAVRAIVLDNQPAEFIAKKFGYKISTISSIVRDARAGKIQLFPTIKKGPKQRQISSELQKKIISLRKGGLSTPDIHQCLAEEGIKNSARTVERILKDAGFRKLKRRTNKERGKAATEKVLPDRAESLDFAKMETFNVDCPSVGVFFFLPYILESQLLNIVKECKLPESSEISSISACLSMLLLKLIGCSRLSHTGAYDQEPGLGIFAGLNILPKPTYMNTYSCRCSETQLMELQEKVISVLRKKYPDYYNSNFINLDFHSIPHFGDESEMEKVWCGAKGKSMKGATTIFAQDSQSKTIIYTRADILRSEEAIEVKKFVDHWKRIKGDVDETLVFDCKFTTYKVLDDLEEDKVKFITLRKRHASLVEKTLQLPREKWVKVYMPIPKRKYKRVSVCETEIRFKGCQKTFRQITVKDHGRSQPTYIVTNNKELALKSILEVYARRWRVENKLSELVAFFNLNALSSPIMIRIHFDILWTIIADTLYHRFAQDLRRFENVLAPQLFKKFIDMPGRIIYDGNKFLVKIRKRGHTPILKEVEKLQNPIHVPWLDDKPLEIIWTA